MVKNGFLVRGVVLLLLASLSYGSYVTNMSFSFSLDYDDVRWFTHDPVNGSFFKPEYYDGTDPDIYNADIKVDGLGTASYEIRNGVFNMDESSLISDQSWFSTMMHHNVAKGVFAGGAQLTLNGELWQKGGASAMYTGPLLVATMDSANWIAEEQEWIPNNVRAVALNFSVDSGALTDGSVGLQMLDFILTFDFMDSQDPDSGGALENFLSYDYIMGSVNNTQITAPIPEPCSLALLVCGAAFIKRKT